MSSEPAKIEIVPSLDCCAETTARKMHKDITAKLLAAEEVDNNIQNELELLRLFLETTDFKSLRGSYERHLIEGKTVKIYLYQEEEKPKHYIVVT